jgi:hypothetical protein
MPKSNKPKLHAFVALGANAGTLLYPSGKDAHAALAALQMAKQAITAAEAMISAHIR